MTRPASVGAAKAWLDGFAGPKADALRAHIEQLEQKAPHPDREAEPAVQTKAEDYDYLLEIAGRLGHDCVLEALEELDRRKEAEPTGGVGSLLRNALACIEKVPGMAHYALLDKAEDDIKRALQALSVSPPVVEGSLRASPCVPTEGHEAAVVGWRPFETAPKDGTYVLAAWGNADPTLYGVIRWEGGQWLESVDDPVGKMTHWMPLPAAPDTALADTQPGIFALRENEPKARHQPTTPGEQGEEG